MCIITFWMSHIQLNLNMFKAELITPNLEPVPNSISVNDNHHWTSWLCQKLDHYLIPSFSLTTYIQPITWNLESSEYFHCFPCLVQWSHTWIKVPPDFLSNKHLSTLQSEWPAQSLNLIMLLPLESLLWPPSPPMNRLGICPEALTYLGLIIIELNTSYPAAHLFMNVALVIISPWKKMCIIHTVRSWVSTNPQ